jgi:hypothetical protein
MAYAPRTQHHPLCPDWNYMKPESVNIGAAECSWCSNKPEDQALKVVFTGERYALAPREQTKTD